MRRTIAPTAAPMMAVIGTLVVLDEEELELEPVPAEAPVAVAPAPVALAVVLTPVPVAVTGFESVPVRVVLRMLVSSPEAVTPKGVTRPFPALQ